MMRRRDFIRSLAIGTGAAVSAGGMSRLYAAPQEYTGRLLVVLQMEGGWDVSSLCDPKSNQPGERVINHWANGNDIRRVGRIPYAPFASNNRLFGRHHRNMLVVNGVDAQTNSHSTGVLHNWSGRNAAGLPTLTALFAARHSPDAPLAYVHHGGFTDTARLIRYSRLNDHESLVELLNPIAVPWERSRNFRSTDDVSRVQRYQQAALERRLAKNSLTPRQRDNVNAYLNARTTRDSLQRFMDVMPEADAFSPDITLPNTNIYSNTLRQVQLTLLSFAAGISSASDLIMWGFDTHAQHDPQHEALFNHFADVLDYFWDYAGELGIAHRITLVIGSDFSRTPHYNADDGKDHWPIGSYIIMEENPGWGNRVVGVTDSGHNALAINPHTLQRDDVDGTLIYPKHVHQALRRHLDLDAFAQERQLGFHITEDIDFFNPDRWTRV